MYTEYFSVTDPEFSVKGWLNPENRDLCEAIWHYFFKLPIDTLNENGEQTKDYIRKFFFKTAQWNEIYDFIDFCAQITNCPHPFIECINEVLKEEFSGYRFINGHIAPITDEQEIKTIEKALTVDDEIKEHLDTAIRHLSDKKKPDYRNSIKESISAVEALCKAIAQTPNASLSDALKTIEQRGNLEFHGAIKKAFMNLYGWTSDAQGIRHGGGMMDLPNLDQEDARFMLISCSAFINYLKTKIDKAGIKIN